MISQRGSLRWPCRSISARDRLRLRHRVGQQDGGGELIMLCLAEQIGCNPGRVGCVVGNDQHLGGPGDHVDIHRAEGELFRRRDKRIARADDLIHLRDDARTVGQRGDRLHAADRDHLVYASDPGRRKHLAAHVIGRRGDHDDLAHARDLSGDGVHQHAGRIRCRAARHVDAHARQPAHGLAEGLPRRTLPLPRFGEHLLVVVADVGRGLFQRADELRRAGTIRLVQHGRLDHVGRLFIKLSPRIHRPRQSRGL